MLLGVLAEHRGPFAADMMRYYGIPLSRAREHVQLWELAAMAKHLPRDSATQLAVDPESSAWGLNEQLLALVADYLAWLQWAKTEDGSKNRNRPRPIPRPGVEDESREVRTFGSDPVALDALDEFLGWATERVQEQKNND